MLPKYSRNTPTSQRKPLILLLAGLLVLTAFAIAFIIFPEQLARFSLGLQRVKNTFAFYVLGEKPRFYYLNMEKNGQELRLPAGGVFALTYRDEFVIKSVASDSLFGKGITIDVEGMGTKNDFRALLKGIALIDHIVQTESALSEIRDNEKYRITVMYNGDPIAAVPIKVSITPQDWLRYARSTENRKLQIEYLKRALAMSSGDVNVIKMLAGVYLRAGMPSEAVVQYCRVLEIEPDDLNSLVALAKCYMDVKQYALAIETSKHILRLKPKETSAFTNIALAYSGLGQWEKAIANYRESLKLQPDNPLAHFKLGEAYEKTGKVKEAIDQYRLVLVKVPNALHAMAALAGAASKIGNHDEAIKWYSEVLRHQPGNASLWANLGLAYGSKGAWKEEVDSYKKSLAIDPNDPIVHFNLALAYEKGKRDREAAAQYEKVLALRPNDVDAQQRLADMDMKAKRYEQAIRRYDKVVKATPKKAALYINLGFAYGELNKYRESAENYEKAIKYGAKDNNLHYNLAYAYDQLGRTKESIKEYEKAAALHPTVDVLSILADYYLKDKQYDNAIRCYKKITELAPKRAAAYSSLGHVYGLKGESDREIEYYKISLRYDAEDDLVYQNLGAAYEKKEMYGEAYKAYVRAYELNPEANRAKARIPQMRIKMLEQKHKK